MKDKILINLVSEAVRILDARKSEKEYTMKKYNSRKDFIDLKVRNVFSIKQVIPSIIKCSHGYNYYSLRSTIINNNIIGLEFLSHSEVEI